MFILPHDFFLFEDFISFVEFRFHGLCNNFTLRSLSSFLKKDSK